MPQNFDYRVSVQMAALRSMPIGTIDPLCMMLSNTDKDDLCQYIHT